MACLGAGEGSGGVVAESHIDLGEVVGRVRASVSLLQISHVDDSECVLTYSILVAFGTSEEQEHRVACTSSVAAACGLAASPAGSSLAHRVVGWESH